MHTYIKHEFCFKKKGYIDYTINDFLLKSD